MTVTGKCCPLYLNPWDLLFFSSFLLSEGMWSGLVCLWQPDKVNHHSSLPIAISHRYLLNCLCRKPHHPLRQPLRSLSYSLSWHSTGLGAGHQKRGVSLGGPGRSHLCSPPGAEHQEHQGSPSPRHLHGDVARLRSGQAIGLWLGLAGEGAVGG